MRKALLAILAASVAVSAAFLALALPAGAAVVTHATVGHDVIQPDPWWNGG